MKLLYLVLVVMVVMAATACVAPAWKIVSALPTDEEVLYTVCLPGTARCLEARGADNTTKPFPPQGAWCKPINKDKAVTGFNCGCRYAPLIVLTGYVPTDAN
jgi:hypothetical protein